MKPSTSSGDEPVICLGGCHHKLRDPESIARGYGPDCWRKLHGPPTRRPRIPRPTRRAVPEQPELPLADQLAIWET